MFHVKQGGLKNVFVGLYKLIMVFTLVGLQSSVIALARNIPANPSISQIHTLFSQDKITCVELINHYLDNASSG